MNKQKNKRKEKLLYLLNHQQQSTVFKKKRINNNNASILFIFIEISQRQNHSPSSTFIRQLIMRYKRQDGATNGGSVRIQPVVCEDGT